MQETIPWGFHLCQSIVEKDGQILGLTVANSFRTLGWSSSGPKAFEGFRPFSNFVTPSLVTTMSSMNGADLSIARLQSDLKVGNVSARKISPA